MNILKYIPGILMMMMIYSLSALSQPPPAEENQEEEAESNRDTLPSFQPHPFIRVGFDVSSIGRIITEPEVRQFEFSADTEFKYNWFAVLEGGLANVEAEREEFHYQASGYFGRLGVDYNLLKRNQPSQNDLILVGLRYGFSTLNHETPFYQISNAYWENTHGSIDKGNFNLHWIELSGGVKTEVFSNFFLGWYLKTRIRIAETRDPELNPYYIAGYGRGTRTAPVMVHFNILYRFEL